MSEFTQPKIIPIENRPPKSKVFVKCIVAPIVIFLIMAKVFSFGWFGSLFFGIWLLWFVITYYFYEYGNTYFAGMTEQLSRQGEQFNYHNRGVWINSQHKTIILFDEPEQRLVKYPFDYITSVGHFNLVEDKISYSSTISSNPMTGTHIRHHEHRSPVKREYQVNIGTRDQFKPHYRLKVLFPWRSPKMASEIRQLLSADHYQ